MASSEDVVALNQLAYRYAAAIDARDAQALLAVFTPDGRMRSYAPDSETPFGDSQGADQLAMVTDQMRERFRKTAHVMTNHTVEVHGDTATGTVLCRAHHLSHDPADQSSLVIVLRYHDEYRRLDGEWRIADRHIRFLWAERDAVVPTGFE